MTEYYKNKKINKTKLLNFGFKKKNDTFIYNQPILDEQFNLTILVDTQGNVHTKLVETATNELYILHLVEDACGDFVGKVKKEYNDNLWLVTNKKVIEAANRCRNEDKCFDNKVTINTLKENGYLDLVVNPITKEVINPESYVDLDSNTFVIV